MQMLTGIFGHTDGFYTDQLTITEDNDGRFTGGYFDGIVDLTHILSRVLGKQLSQTATYRVNYLEIGLRNVDDTVDNSQAIMVGGNVNYYAPTKHRIDSIQTVRDWYRLKGQTDASSTDPFALMTTDKNYRGLRFQWNETGVQISDPTDDDSGSKMAGRALRLLSMFNMYNSALQGTPSAEGYDSSGEGQALWEKRCSIVPNGLQFACSHTNRIESEGFASLVPPEDDFFMHDPKADTWKWTAPAGHSIDVLGGLIKVALTHGNVDSPGIIEDDYQMIVTVGVTGWDEF